jgi:DNA polymerase-3 subunit delta'
MNDLAPWQRAPFARALEAMAENRLAHALLFCGPERIGKRVVAERLAQALLCRQRGADGDACGSCRSCELFNSRASVDPREVRPEGNLVHPDGRRGHPDFRIVSYELNEKANPIKMFGVITVDQIRDLGASFALTPQRGGAQVALIEPATAMNDSAANALLKSLEEPLENRYVLLVTAHPAKLPATIRSRCQRIEFRLPETADALAWLQARGHAMDVAQGALDAARGHPGLAAHWLEDGLLAIRERVRSDLVALAQPVSAKSSARPLQLAATWLADDATTQRLEFAAAFALELQALLVGAQPVDFDQRLARLTVGADFQKLSAWFDAANRTRELLRTPIRADLALAGLLRDWREAMRARPSQLQR